MQQMDRLFRAAAIAVAVAAVVFLVAVSHAHARDGHGPGGVNHADHLAHMASALGLSDQQKAAAKKLHEQAAGKAGPLKEQARLQHEEIEALLEAGSPDPTEVGRRVIEMHATHKKLEALHEQTLGSFRAQLGPEQRAKLDRMMKQHRGHGPGGHGHAWWL